MLTISLFPIPIHADTITTDNIVGVSAVVSDSLVNGQVTYNSQTFNVYYVNYDVEIIFDQAYLGYVQLTLEYDYYNRDSSGIVDRTNNQTRRVFVNGTSAHINLNILSSYSNSPLKVTYNNPRVSTITTGGTNVTPIGDLADIQQIIEILQNIYSLEGDIEGLENNQLLQLQQVVANTSLANTYLQTLTEIRQWNFPIESFSYIYQFYSFGYTIVDLFDDSYYIYPIFNVNENDRVFRSQWSNGTDNYKQKVVLAVNKNVYNYNNFLLYFDVSDLNISNYKVLYRKDYPPSVNQYCIISFDVNTIPNSSVYFGFIRSKTNCNIIPIYNEYSSALYPSYISTDFALQFGLSNKLLDDLDIIANGTSSSSSSSNDLDDTTSQFQTDSNSLISIEDSFNSTMNSNLDNINPTFNMGSSFLASANWVSTQFNRIVNNTPFASLITFGLTLGLGLLIIGKIRK